MIDPNEFVDHRVIDGKVFIDFDQFIQSLYVAAGVTLLVEDKNSATVILALAQTLDGVLEDMK